jgi:hypothetical protein
MSEDQTRDQELVRNIRNSRFFAPLIAVGVIVIALAAFTNAISALRKFVGWDVETFTPSAGGPVFEQPMLNERTLDGCVLTMKSQVQAEGDPEACNTSSQMEIASQFCQVAHYRHALTFRAEDTLKFHTSYKLAQTLTQEGEMKYVWNRDDRGGFVFTSITCEN